MNVHFNPIFDDLPLLILPSYQFPTHDGDMAELHELADRVIDNPHGGRVTVHPLYAIYNSTVDATWIHPLQMLKSEWDRAGELLREWING